MKLPILFSLTLLSLLAASRASAELATLEMVASFPKRQVTGVAVSKEGRIFVNFPHWSDDHTLSVAEIIDGKPVRVSERRVEWGGRAGQAFRLRAKCPYRRQRQPLILDPAAPKMQETVKGGPKLVKVDLVKNAVVQTILFSERVAPKKRYLNNVRVDTKTQSLGAIIVVDLRTGKARRVLEGDRSPQAEKDFKLQVKGRDLLGENGKPPQIHSDGIAVDSLNGLLYYHALTGRTLYRIKAPAIYQADYQADPGERVAELPAWILGHLHERITVDTLAERTCLCPRHFSRLFKRSSNAPRLILSKSCD